MERTLSIAKASESNEGTGSSTYLPRLLATLFMWQRRIQTRRQLAHLDERLLADTGISAAQPQAELDKPFWR